MEQSTQQIEAHPGGSYLSAPQAKAAPPHSNGDTAPNCRFVDSNSENKITPAAPINGWRRDALRFARLIVP
jgi:hypothetical protein